MALVLSFLSLSLGLGLSGPAWAQQAGQEASPSQEASVPSAPEPAGYPFRFLGATYVVDGAVDASYLYRFDHERIPTAEAAPEILDQKFITHVFHLDLALAVTNRPWRGGQFAVGLRWQQDWHASHREMTDYLADVSDLDAFPWTARVLETDRQMYGWYRHRLTPSTFVNLYGAYRVRHEGALTLSLQERKNTADNAPRLRSLKWLPSLAVATPRYGTFMPYLYFIRQQNYSDTGLSFETFRREGTASVSFGLRHLLTLIDSRADGSNGAGDEGLELMTELYRHSYTFNQFYHDYDRLGLVARLDGRLRLAGSLWGVGGILAMSQDRFRHSQIVVNSCTFPDGSSSSERSVACARQDSNLYGSLWAHYRLTPKHVWSFRYSQQSIQSNLGRHHRHDEFQYILGYQYNFDGFHGRQTFSDTQLDRIYGKKAYTYD